MGLEEFYLTKAEECRQAGDSFGASYWMTRAFEAACLEDNL